MKLHTLVLLCLPALSCGSIHEELRSKAERDMADGARLIEEDESDLLNTTTYMPAVPK